MSSSSLESEADHRVNPKNTRYVARSIQRIMPKNLSGSNVDYKSFNTLQTYELFNAERIR
jgi:hypothetical protein